MGSIEEENNLLQMVHDFIECESTTSSSSLSNKNLDHLRHSTRYFTLQEILKEKTREERRIEEKVGKYMKNIKLGIEITRELKQWLVKCLILDGFHASLVHTTPSCPCGSYEYIEIVEQEVRGGLMTIIVDIDLKSQFEVARPTQSYKDLLNKLPSIFVGKETKLNRIITLLCSAAEESLKEQGLHIPPWRRSTYMQSKWNLSNFNTNPNINQDYSSRGDNKVNHVNNHNNVISRQVGFGGSGLSNQFSKMGINCC